MSPRRKTIAVIGSASAVEPAISDAREVGLLIAENGWVLITGGRSAGVMRAANEGAKAAKDSVTIGILPDRNSDVSADVDVAIFTDTGEARNNIIVLSADVVVACGVDGAGTASEVALALKNGKHVVLLNASKTAREFFLEISSDNIHVASSPQEAIDTARKLVA